MDRLVGVMDGRIAIGTEARVCGGTLKLNLDTECAGARQFQPHPQLRLQTARHSPPWSASRSCSLQQQSPRLSQSPTPRNRQVEPVKLKLPLAFA